MSATGTICSSKPMNKALQRVSELQQANKEKIQLRKQLEDGVKEFVKRIKEGEEFMEELLSPRKKTSQISRSSSYMAPTKSSLLKSGQRKVPSQLTDSTLNQKPAGQNSAPKATKPFRRLANQTETSAPGRANGSESAISQPQGHLQPNSNLETEDTRKGIHAIHAASSITNSTRPADMEPSAVISSEPLKLPESSDIVTVTQTVDANRTPATKEPLRQVQKPATGSFISRISKLSSLPLPKSQTEPSKSLQTPIEKPSLITPEPKLRKTISSIQIPQTTKSSQIPYVLKTPKTSPRVPSVNTTKSAPQTPKTGTMNVTTSSVTSRLLSKIPSPKSSIASQKFTSTNQPNVELLVVDAGSQILPKKSQLETTQSIIPTKCPVSYLSDSSTEIPVTAEPGTTQAKEIHAELEQFLSIPDLRFSPDNDPATEIGSQKCDNTKENIDKTHSFSISPRQIMHNELKQSSTLDQANMSSDSEDIFNVSSSETHSTATADDDFSHFEEYIAEVEPPSTIPDIAIDYPPSFHEERSPVQKKMAWSLESAIGDANPVAQSRWNLPQISALSDEPNNVNAVENITASPFRSMLEPDFDSLYQPSAQFTISNSPIKVELKAEKVLETPSKASERDELLNRALNRIRQSPTNSESTVTTPLRRRNSEDASESTTLASADTETPHTPPNKFTLFSDSIASPAETISPRTRERVDAKLKAALNSRKPSPSSPSNANARLDSLMSRLFSDPKARQQKSNLQSNSTDS